MSKSSAPSQATLADPEVLQAKPSPTRDDDLWFDDGTLIIVAQNVEFRVYRNYLAERFEVFRDMLSFPQPTLSESTDDLPCPAIHVTDSARDWRNVLRLLFYPEEQGLFVKRSDPSFDVVSACVRLGHKYQMTSVYQQAMDYLKVHFTADLLICKSRRNWVPPGFTLAHAIGVVNLARLTGEHTLLPIALMVCCRKEADIVEGFTYDDGEHWQEKLVHDDLGLCFAAKARLLKVTILAYFTTYAPPPPESCDLKDGDASRRALQGLADIAAQEVQRATLPNPIVVLNYALTGSGPRLCNGCSTAVKSRQLERQRQNWKQLPSVLGIDVPGW